MKIRTWALAFLTTSAVAFGEGQFGAICVALRTGAVGTSTGMYSETAAKNKALFVGNINQGNEPSCRVVQSMCVAVFVDAAQQKLYWGYHGSAKEAFLIAESSCFDSTIDCRYVASTCGKAASESSWEDAEFYEEK